MICETLNDLVTTEHEPQPAQYQLVVGALHALAARAHHAQTICESYVLRALALAGWTPRLHACVVCGRTDGLTFFSSAAGGAMCMADHTPEAKPTNAAVLRQLRALLDGDWRTLDAQPLEPGTERLVEDWAQYYLERPIRSLRLLD